MYVKPREEAVYSWECSSGMKFHKWIIKVSSSSLKFQDFLAGNECYFEYNKFSDLWISENQPCTYKHKERKMYQSFQRLIQFHLDSYKLLLPNFCRLSSVNYLNLISLKDASSASSSADLMIRQNHWIGFWSHYDVPGTVPVSNLALRWNNIINKELNIGTYNFSINVSLLLFRFSVSALICFPFMTENTVQLFCEWLRLTSIYSFAYSGAYFRLNFK